MAETMTEQEATERRLPRWDECMVTIATAEGPREIRGLAHPWCPGLAVTMSVYGEFEVTHRASGLRLGGNYERMGSACLEAAEWAAIARMAGMSWETSDTRAVAAAMRGVAEKEVPFGGATETDKKGTRRMSVASWITIVRSNSTWDELPWESSDEHPLTKADAVLATLAPEAPAHA